MKRMIVMAAGAALVLVAGCGGANHPAAHAAASPAPAPTPTFSPYTETQQSPSTAPVGNTRVCNVVEPHLTDLEALLLQVEFATNQLSRPAMRRVLSGWAHALLRASHDATEHTGEVPNLALDLSLASGELGILHSAAVAGDPHAARYARDADAAVARVFAACHQITGS